MLSYSSLCFHLHTLTPSHPHTLTQRDLLALKVIEEKQAGRDHLELKVLLVAWVLMVPRDSLEDVGNPEKRYTTHTNKLHSHLASLYNVVVGTVQLGQNTKLKLT